MKKIFFIALSSILLSCKPPNNTQFKAKALTSPVSTLNDVTLTFNDVIEKNKGKLTLIDVWASWCGDCITGLPTLKNIQQNYPDVNYVFISLDRNKRAWKNGIKRFSIKGEHYYVDGGWKSIFAKKIDLDWIPRYIMIDPTGKVVVYRAIKANDSDIIKILENQNN
ncbi:TlpA family protein disulfide reductase [Wenyingzhuangia sp. IMCC45533]